MHTWLIYCPDWILQIEAHVTFWSRWYQRGCSRKTYCLAKAPVVRSNFWHNVFLQVKNIFLSGDTRLSNCFKYDWSLILSISYKLLLCHKLLSHKLELYDFVFLQTSSVSVGAGKKKKTHCRNECQFIEMKHGRSVLLDKDKINYMLVTQKQLELYFIHLFLLLFEANCVFENR